MAPLAQLIIGNLVRGIVEHKTSSAGGAGALAVAASIPALGNSGNIVIPSTLEEGIAQVVFTLIGLALFYFNPKKQK